MGISLGWVVFLVAGVTGAPPAERGAAQISYTVKMVEAEGVGWRESVFTRLKPVSRQGAATVWTFPKNATASLIKEICKNPAGSVVAAPRVTAIPGVPAAIQVRGNRTFVTQVAWNGDEIDAKGTPEDVRVGWHATMIGRTLDQGILVKLVIEDTEIRGVHKVKVGCPSVDWNALKKAVPVPSAFAESPFDVKEPEKSSPEGAADCKKAETAGSADASFCGGVFDDRPALELPEIANQEVLGEWLIPKGECLLVSFGPHTVADKDGKAIVKERLAVVEADEHTGAGASAHRAMGAVPRYEIPPPPSPFAPPARFGEPIPEAPVPPTAAFRPTPPPSFDQVLPPARYMRDDLQYLAPAPTVNEQAGSQPTESQDKNTEAPARIARVPAPIAPIAPTAKMPAVPDRSIPQGIHKDGTKAKLPPLPEDEMDDDSTDSESSEPLPSPQTKKPWKPKPAGDVGTTKATFTQPKSSTVFLPSVFLPGATVGFQFLLPIKPLSLKLPFNQRLEIEVFGRVIPDTRVADSDK